MPKRRQEELSAISRVSHDTNVICVYVRVLRLIANDYKYGNKENVEGDLSQISFFIFSILLFRLYIFL